MCEHSQKQTLEIAHFLHKGSYPLDFGFPPCFFPVSLGQKVRRIGGDARPKPFLGRFFNMGTV
jgi:hypothetical protein